MNPRGPMTPPNLGHPSIGYPLYPQYLCALSASPVGEKFSYREMDDNFADLPTEWGSNDYDQGTSPARQEEMTFYPLFEPCCTNQVADDVRPDFSTMHAIDQPPPSTVLPSQTLKSPNLPASGLATPFLSPVKTEAHSPSYMDQSDGLSFDYSPKEDDILIDDSLSLHENGLDSFKRTVSRKRQRQEEDSTDEDLPSKRVPKIPFIVKSWMEKPYPCHVCKKGFDRHEHLTRHNKSDSHRKTVLKEYGVEPPAPRKYPCPFCGKLFDRPDNVKPHMKTHMHDGGGNYKNASVSVRESERKGLGKIDPRSDDYEKESKKARTKKRGG